MLLLGLIIAGTISYTYVGMIIGTLAWRESKDWEDWDQGVATFFFGVFWPLALPAKGIYHSAMKSVKYLETREKQKKLPKAEVRNG